MSAVLVQKIITYYPVSMSKIVAYDLVEFIEIITDDLLKLLVLKDAAVTAH